ncbi:MAG TPA: TIGR02611 family protein [Rugosimonospora sp.]|nr:TIGR02611 family protein [Rugosimonospora sp.]
MTDDSDPSGASRSQRHQGVPDTPVRAPRHAWHLRLVWRMRATPGTRLLLRLGVGVVGTLVVITGIILLPLPGPGWAIIFLGIAIWAIEFTWARRLLLFGRARYVAWLAWYARQGWPARVLMILGTALLVIVIVAGALWLSLGPRVRALIPR